MKDWIKKTISNKNVFIVIFVVFALAASTQALLGPKTYADTGKVYTKYTNYSIFEQSFHHLVNKQDLYASYTQGDYYKYTPTFAALFGIFAIFPDWVGLNLWNLLNALLLLFAVYSLPRIDNYQKGLILLIVVIELMTSMQNQQSNALIAALFIFTFILLENKKYVPATLLIMLSVYIKLFGIVAFALFIFYPKKWKLVLYSAIWFVILFLVPLIFISFDEYWGQLKSFWGMLSYDHGVSYGYSVMGWLYSWFNIELNKNIIVIAGGIILLLPLIRYKEYKDYTFRSLALASVLIWVVIFNHKAESPTFIIAMSGVALWFVQSRKNAINIILFVIAFVLTTLSPTDIFPKIIREEYFIPYSIKALPCILIWFLIVYRMMFQNKTRNDGML